MSEQKITEREAFKAALVEWWPQAKGNLNIEDGEYSNHLMNYAWWGWQASQKHRAASHDVAESNSGWMLVPIEPTEAMILAAQDSEDVLFDKDDDSLFVVDHKEIYRAMLENAPEASNEQ